MVKGLQQASESIKCGEIFYSTASHLNVTCSLCQYEINLEDFAGHFQIEHLTAMKDDNEEDIISMEVEEEKNQVNSSLMDDICGNTEVEEEEESIYDLLEIYEVKDETLETEIISEEAYLEDASYVVEDEDKHSDGEIKTNEELKQILEEDLEEFKEDTYIEEISIVPHVDEENTQLSENTEVDNNNCDEYLNNNSHSREALSDHEEFDDPLHSQDHEEEDTLENDEYLSDDDFPGFTEIEQIEEAESYLENESISKENINTDTKEMVDLAHPCPQCENSYHTKHGLEVHLRNAHNPDKSTKKRPLKPPNKCKECHQIFRSSRDLQSHMFKHTGIYCDVCGRSFAQISHLTRHKIRHSTKNFKCELCGKPFFTAKEVKQHMVSHTNEVAVICEVCGKGCRNATILNAHMRRHTGERPFKCDECGKCFFSFHDLKIHAVAHTNERPFECDICHSTFQRKKALRVHKLTHSQNRKHTCKICGKSYAQASSLKTHLRSHNATVSKPAFSKEETLGLTFEDMVLKSSLKDDLKLEE